ncbi:hypothetical protein GGR56DRAFT_634974 [Xylariaceae sp. FL0804]|nr:hypothetical protein GGR56DRAFT_634974 [Xylariaceae sp. FL0804]
MPSRAYETYRGGHHPPGRYNLGARQFSSVPLMVLLYSAAMPFTPVAWLFPVDGAFFVDRMCAGVVLLCACYFQYAIAGLDRAVAVSLAIPGLPSGSGGRPTIRNGHMQSGGGGGGGVLADLSFVWQTSNYWPYAACEAVLLALAEFGPSETLRRSVVCGVLAGLWLVGFHATPRAYRVWAWEHIKAWWFWIILSELLNVGRPNVARRGRRF